MGRGGELAGFGRPQLFVGENGGQIWVLGATGNSIRRASCQAGQAKLGCGGARGEWCAPQGRGARQSSPLFFSVEKTPATRSCGTGSDTATRWAMQLWAVLHPRYTPFGWSKRGIIPQSSPGKKKTPHRDGEGSLPLHIRLSYSRAAWEQLVLGISCCPGPPWAAACTRSTARHRNNPLYAEHRSGPG